MELLHSSETSSRTSSMTCNIMETSWVSKPFQCQILEHTYTLLLQILWFFLDCFIFLWCKPWLTKTCTLVVRILVPLSQVHSLEKLLLITTLTTVSTGCSSVTLKEELNSTKPLKLSSRKFNRLLNANQVCSIALETTKSSMMLMRLSKCFLSNLIQLRQLSPAGTSSLLFTSLCGPWEQAKLHLLTKLKKLVKKSAIGSDRTCLKTVLTKLESFTEDQSLRQTVKTLLNQTMSMDFWWEARLPSQYLEKSLTS